MAGRTISLAACALVGALAACSRRPLPAAEEGAIDAAGAADTVAPCSRLNPRIDPVGAPVLVFDSPPLMVALYTSLLWTGEEYLFVWRTFKGDGVFVQRLDADGQGVGGNIRLGPVEAALDVAWSASSLGAAWVRDGGAMNELMFRTFDGLGRPLIDEVVLRAAPGIPIDGGSSYGPRIVPIAGGFAIAWSEAEQVLVGAADRDGHLLLGPVATASGAGKSPILSLAAAGDRIVVGWSGQPVQRSPPSYRVRARVFSTALAPLTDVIPVDDDAFPAAAQVLATDDGFVALWSRGEPSDVVVRVAQFDAAGAARYAGEMPAPITGRYRDRMPAAWDGDSVVIAWGGSAVGETGLALGRYWTSGAQRGPTVTLPTAGVAARTFLVAHDRSVAFIYSETVSGADEVYFQRAQSCP